MLKWISEQGPESKYLSFYSPSCCFQTCMTYFHRTLEKIEGCSLVVAQKHHLTYHKSGPYDICDFYFKSSEAILWSHFESVC